MCPGHLALKSVRSGHRQPRSSKASNLIDLVDDTSLCGSRVLDLKHGDPHVLSSVSWRRAG